MARLVGERRLALGVACGGLVLAGIAGADPRFAPIGDLPGAQFWSVAAGLSADGWIVVGQSEALVDDPPGAYSLDEAFRWTREGGIEGLGILAVGPSFPVSGALATSADGRIVVGFSSHDDGRMALRWTPETGMEGLGDLGLGYVESEANDVTDDGSVIVGRGYNVSTQASTSTATSTVCSPPPRITPLIGATSA